MAIENVSKILTAASKNATAVVGFNCFDYHTIYASINAAERFGVPVFCTLYPDHASVFNLIDLKSFAETTKSIAGDKKVSVGIHLDHCSDMHFIKRAINAGFNSVMYDGSRLPYEQNVRECTEIVEYAHKLGVCVESELGYIGDATNIDEQNKSFYTNADMARDFVGRAKPDSIAISIGNAHGRYNTSPVLDLELLKTIHHGVTIPLVLHGGTGIPTEQIKASIKLGIRKINIGTELHDVWRKAYQTYATDPLIETVAIGAKVQNDLQDYILNKFDRIYT